MDSYNRNTEKDQLALATFVKFTRAYDAVKTRLDDKQIAGDLNETQFGVLEMLYHAGPLHQQSISDKLLVSKSNVVSVIDKLEKLGMVKRLRSEEDRRYIFIHLTDEGREKIESLLPYHLSCIAEEMNKLTVDELTVFGDLCRKLGLAE